LRTSTAKQHSVGQHRGRSDGSARQKDFADIRKHKRLASGYENFLHAKLCRFVSDAPYAIEPKVSSRSAGRRTYTTVVAMQVAVEVCIKPKPGAHRPILVD